MPDEKDYSKILIIYSSSDTFRSQEFNHISCLNQDIILMIFSNHQIIFGSCETSESFIEPCEGKTRQYTQLDTRIAQTADLILKAWLARSENAASSLLMSSLGNPLTVVHRCIEFQNDEISHQFMAFLATLQFAYQDEHSIHCLNYLAKLAVEKNYAKTLSALLDVKADINHESSSLLTIAITFGNVQTVQVLLERRADIVQIGNKNNNTALHIAVKNGSLHQRENFLRILDLLLAAKANLETQNKSKATPLLCAFEWNKYGFALELMKRGACPDQCHEYALLLTDLETEHCVGRKFKMDCAKWLLRADVYPSTVEATNLITKIGPLHEIALKRHDEMEYLNHYLKTFPLDIIYLIQSYILGSQIETLKKEVFKFRQAQNPPPAKHCFCLIM